ncbi:hypothetical protein CBR_g28920 [Chara braunii]|uniref:CCHC-type domain-containing protein n=1 Tax=Chara braunii TaxID=69332 RepID=A0A388LAJ6_CHABU|nr:hypothetical protein CBR_g28920 [Chara braunii]|eukprot:GBG79203.1 hypothetical protein CBR_g28920 [Chara braunii]
MASNVVEEECGDVFGTVRGRASNEVGTFGQAADNDVDAIMPTVGLGKTADEVHGDGLPTDGGDGGVVSADGDVLPVEVRTPDFEGVDHDEKFLLVGGVIHLRGKKLLASEGDGVFAGWSLGVSAGVLDGGGVGGVMREMLGQYGSNGEVGGISGDIEVAGGIGDLEYGDRGDGVEEVGGGVLLEAAVEEGVVCAVEEGGAAVVTTVMKGLFPSSVVTRSDMDGMVAFVSSREAVTGLWKVLSVWRMAERSEVAVFAGGCSPARLPAMLSTESVRISNMLMEDAAMSGEEGVEDTTGTDVEDAAAAVAAAARWEFLVWRGGMWRDIEMSDTDGIKRGPAATPEDFVKALEKRELARLQVPKVDIFLFDGDGVSEWLELLEQVTSEASKLDKFKLMPRYVWWELRPEVRKVATSANGDWSKFKEEMQRRFKLGDGVLTKADQEMLSRNEFTTVRWYGQWVSFGPPGPWPGFNPYTPWPVSGQFGSYGGPQMSMASCGYSRPQAQQASQSRVNRNSLLRKGRRAIRAVVEAKAKDGDEAEGMVAVVEMEEEMRAVTPMKEEMRVGMTEGIKAANRVAEDMAEVELDWRNAICWHCGQKGHTIKFCRVWRSDENDGLMSTNYDGDIYDMYGKYIDPRTPGGTREEALRRANAPPPAAPPAAFRMWQEKEVYQDVRVEEVGESEEVEQGMKTDIVKEEPIVVEPDDEEEGGQIESRDTMERMEDRLAKIGRYQTKLTTLCEEVNKWRGELPFVLRVDPTALVGSLKNFAPSDPTIARWLTYIWMFDFELERIRENKNRADGLSRVDWDKSNRGVIEDTPPVDGFLDSAEDVRLHINSWSVVVGNYVTLGRRVWLAPPGHVRRPDLVLKPYIEEDSWGMPCVEWMMDLALANKYQLHEDLLTIENGAQQVEKHEKSVGGIYLLANALLQDEVVRNAGQSQEEGDNVIHEGEDDDFEEGEIKEAFRAEEYDGVYLELGMLLSCEMRERDASEKFLKMRPNFLVRDGLTPFGAAMPRRRGRAGSVETPLGVTRQRTQIRTRREDMPPLFRGGNIELFLFEFERHAQEFGWDGTRMLREVRGAGEWVDPIALLVRESLTWQAFERKMEGLHPSSVGRDGRPIRFDSVGRDGRPIRFDSTNLGEFIWAYDRYADGLNVTGEQRMGSFLLYVRRHIRSFVRSIVAPATNWGHCKKLLWNYYTPARQADERSMEKKRKEPEAAEKKTFEHGMTSGAQKEDERKEHRPHRYERREEQPDERTQRGGASGGSSAPPQPAQMDEDHSGEQPVELKNRKGEGVCTQKEDLPLLTEVWASFDKLMEAARRPREHHQEMGVQLVSTNLLSLRGLMKEGLAAAKASDQKVGERLTKVAQKAYGQRVDWEREIDTLKKELERQSKEVEAVKAEMVEVWAKNEAIRQVNQTFNKVNDVLRAYLQAQQVSFQAKEAEWEKRIKDLEASLTLGPEPAKPEERPPAEAMRIEAVPPMTQGETVGQQGIQESLGQAIVEAELRGDLKVCQESTTPQDMPLVAGLEDASGSWATGSGPEGRVGEQVAQTHDRAAYPTPPEVPQQEVTSKVMTTPSSVPSQGGDKMEQKKVGRCFYCKRGKHLVPQEPQG